MGASRPPRATSCGPATGCTARRSAGGPRSCSRSSTTTAARWSATGGGPREDVLRLEAALRSGLCARGVPDGILVDRGSAFVSHQLLRACAVLGVRLIHASPRAATTKGKIERFFRTVRDQFLVELAGRASVADLAELNRLFTAWVEVGLPPARALRDRADADRAVRGGGPPALPTPALLREAFLWQRDADGHQDRDRVAARQPVRGRRGARSAGGCELVFDPFDLTADRGPLPGPPDRAGGARADRPPHPPAGQARASPACGADAGSTTSGCSPPSATPNWAASGSTTATSRHRQRQRRRHQQTTGAKDEYRPVARALRLLDGCRSARTWHRGCCTATAPISRRSRGSVVHGRASDGGDLRRMRRRQDRRGASRRSRRWTPPATRSFTWAPRAWVCGPLRRDRHRPRRHTAVSLRGADPPGPGSARRRSAGAPKQVVVVVDEAHLLDADSLEGLRCLSNADMDQAAAFACCCSASRLCAAG